MYSSMLVITQSLGLVVLGIKIGGIILHKFGSTGIVTGYIKQLLASFNLPTTRIYTREHEAYFEKLFSNVTALYRLDQGGVKDELSGGKAEFPAFSHCG